MAPGTEAKPLVWLHGEIKTPPFSPCGVPHSRPMPSIGPGCHATPVHIVQVCRQRLVAHRGVKNQERSK